MAIFGIGTDLVEVARIKESLENLGDRFVERIAHPEDLALCPTDASQGRVAEYWASRFAVKEAFSKALGTGIGKHCAFTAIGVAKTEAGKPELVLSDDLLEYCESVGVRRAHVSLSHTSTHASAFVVLES